MRMRTSLGWLWLPLALAAPLVATCIDDHEAEDCVFIGSCPPDAGATQAPPCAGRCVPGNVSLDWSGDPWLVWMGEQSPPDAGCPEQAPHEAYDGTAPPPAPACGVCTCGPATGSCGFPASATAHGDDCPGAGTGTAFDAPATWDGSCTTEDAIAGGVQSLTVSPLVRMDDGCIPKTAFTESKPASSWPVVRACGGEAAGDCENPGDVCVPSPPPRPWGAQAVWTYCIRSTSGLDEEVSCPSEYPYAHVFARGYTGTASCSPCTCGPPVGSDCASVLSVYADDACSDLIGAVSASSSASKCDDMPAGSPLGSKSATPPVYEPGACAASGGSPTVPAPVDEVTLCCLD